MASDFQKPDRVHTLYSEEIREKMWPLSVSDLFFVGRATTKKLLSVGIRTIGDLANADVSWLKSLLKKHGEVIWKFANGIDFSPVLASPAANKGYGNSTTIPYDVVSIEAANKVLLALAETLGSRLRADEVQTEVLAVGIRYADISEENIFPFVSHQKKLLSPTNLTAEIYKEACELFLELWNGNAIRHLGIHTGKVQDEMSVRQLCLFDETDYEKLAGMDKMVDSIRERFGIDALKRAVFLGQTIDHMCGGISREKRYVDYSKLIVR